MITKTFANVAIAVLTAGGLAACGSTSNSGSTSNIGANNTQTAQAVQICGQDAASKPGYPLPINKLDGAANTLSGAGSTFVGPAMSIWTKDYSDAHDALALGAGIKTYLLIPDVLECLAVLADEDGSHREAARLFGAAHSIRQRMGAVRFKVWDAGYEASAAAVRDALGEQDFDAAWAEGAAMSTEEAIAYAQRGRGERKRPTSGWASLTPTERDVVRLVSEGLGNKDIATRLFVSPRTVQTHLTHVYTKLGLSSRMQLAQEAARHA